MELRFCIQDPTHPKTTYLYEAIMTSAVDGAAWRGCSGVNSGEGKETPCFTTNR